MLDAKPNFITSWDFTIHERGTQVATIHNARKIFKPTAELVVQGSSYRVSRKN